MNKNLKALITLVAVLAMTAVSATAGDNILANGTITIAAGATSGTNLVELSNVTGQEWGEIAQFRTYNGCSATSGYVVVSCEDMTKTVSLIASDSTTNLTLHILQTNVWSCVGTNLFAKEVKIIATLDGAYTNAAVTWPWIMYVK